MKTIASIIDDARSGAGTVGILGLGVTGLAAAEYLVERGVRVIGLERSQADNAALRRRCSPGTLERLATKAELHFGIDGEKLTPYLEGMTACVISPGVSTEGAACGALKRNHIRLTSELELALAFSQNEAVVVTGSNGKSTTTQLLAAMLDRSGIPHLK